MTDNVTQFPEPGVVLDLDSLQRDPKEVKPPFIVRVGGRNITFADPNDIDWRDLVDINHPSQLLSFSLTRDDREHILGTDLPGWKFNELMEAYYVHYDFEKKIAEARRRAQFDNPGPGRGF